MIERAIKILQKAGFDFTARELAEIFWLAVHLDEEEQNTSQVKQQVDNKQNSPQLQQPVVDQADSPPLQQPVEDKQESTPKTQPQIQPPPQNLPLTLPQNQKPTPKPKLNLTTPIQKGVSIQVPAAPALRNTLELGRALRPLMRKVPSSTEQVLDEEATVYQIAEQDIWVPVFQPKPQRWLELALVVEKSNSIAVWKPTIRELEKLLKHHGAFRDVRTWELKVTPTALEPTFSLLPLKLSSQSNRNQSNTRDNNSTSYSPDVLIDPKGQRLILLVSDCISTAWRDKWINPVLNLWGNKSLLAILQLLPEQLWERTALSSQTPVQLSSLKPGVPNSQLIATIWDEDDIEDYSFEQNSGENSTFIESISVPIITLEPQPLLTWSRVIAGFGNITTAGFKFSLSELEKDFSYNSETNTNQTNTNQQTQLSADALVNRFRATASPTARRLAGLMAAAPVSLPVVQLIQQTLIPNSRQIHAAEVFMSGLLKSTTPENTQVDYVEYEFIPGVRELLVDSVPKSKTISVIDAVSEYIARRLSLSVREFEAQLLLSSSGNADLVTKIRPFAQIKAQVLRRLGGIYTYIAEELEQNSQTVAKSLQVAEGLEGFPPLRTFEFKIATILTEDENEIETPADINLQTFEFQVATIELKKTELIINRHHEQNQYFIENLGNETLLDMVLIPAGQFIMGAPEDEEGSSYSERPQHQVTVPSFFMGKYPVTQAQWKAVAELPRVNRELEEYPSEFKGDNRPVEQVSWYDAIEFCTRLSNYTRRGYRLPSEAEWEYACRADTITPFHFGETITSKLVNYYPKYIYGLGIKDSFVSKTTSVGSFRVANTFGLYDMHGNVWEWCLDDWHDNYKNAPTDGSAWLDYNSNFSQKTGGAVLRGGSWLYHPGICRSAYRYGLNRAERDNFSSSVGFRVVCAFRQSIK